MAAVVTVVVGVRVVGVAVVDRVRVVAQDHAVGSVKVVALVCVTLARLLVVIPVNLTVRMVVSVVALQHAQRIALVSVLQIATVRVALDVSLPRKPDYRKDLLYGEFI